MPYTKSPRPYKHEYEMEKLETNIQEGWNVNVADAN